MSNERGTKDAKQCPWCMQWALKDAACNWVCCGDDTRDGFVAGAGCGQQWCFECGKKLCGRLFNSDGQKQNVLTNHNAECCKTEEGFKQEEYCPGGHNSHVGVRW